MPPLQRSVSWLCAAVLSMLGAAGGLAVAAATAPASTFTVASSGEKPDVAVDPSSGAGIVVWNRPAASSAESDVTQVCRIPRGGSVCQDLQNLIPPQPGSNHELAVPRVLVSGSQVVVLTTRGSNDTVWRFTSSDGGASFDAGQPVGDDGYDPFAEAILGPGASITTISPGGVLRMRPLGGTGASPAIDVFPGPQYSGATIGLADAAHALAVAQADDGQLYLTRQVGADIASAASWTAPVAIGAGSAPQLVSGVSGLWLFSDHVPAPVDVRRWDGTSFGAGSSVTGGQAVGSEHAFDEDAGGGLQAVYRSTGEGGLQGGVITTSSADGAAWTPLQQLADPSVGAFRLRVAAVAPKDGFAVWQREAGASEVLGAALGTATSLIPPADGTTSSCRTLSFRPVEALSVDGCWTQDGTASVAPGKVRVNGLDIDPKAGAKVVVDSAKRTIVTRGGAGAFVHAGSIPIAAGPVAWQIGDGSTSHVTDGDTGKLGADLFGLAIRGTSSVDLQPGEATIAAHVSLPKLFGDITGDVKLRTDNATGLRLDGIDVAVKNALLGPLEIKDLSLKHVAAGDIWQGSGDLVLPPRPPGAELVASFGLAGGAFDYAKGSFTFPAPGVAMAPSVFLNEIHFSLATKPTRIVGGVQLTAGPQVAGAGAVGIRGDLSYTFADPPAPAILRASGTGSVVGIPIADVALEYRSSGLFTFGAHLDYTFLETFHVKAGIDGFVDTSAGTFMVDGTGGLTCAIPVLCPLDVHTILSSKGVAACGAVTVLDVPVSLGFGYRWGKGVDLFLLSGCDLDDYRVQATAAQAGGERGVRLGGGPFAIVAVVGAGTPDVTLRRGRSGPVIATKAILDSERGVTYLFVPHPRPGTYRVVPAADSPPITDVAVAGGLPKPAVRARVAGAGRRRTLRYVLRAIPGQRVTFTEEAGAVARRIGTARGARGRLRFAPGAGPAGRRTIFALVEQDGRPRAKLVVARYRAPAAARPSSPRGLAVRRRGRTVTVTWRRVPAIRLYRVEARLTDGRRVVELLTTPKLVLTDVAPGASGTVKVAAATPDLRTSRAATARVAKLGAKHKAKARHRRSRR